MVSDPSPAPPSDTPSAGPAPSPIAKAAAALWGLKGTVFYVALIPFINWSFTWAPMIPVAEGVAFNPVTVVTGLVLVVRDFAQREIGHYVLAAMAVALGLTFLTSGGELALASGLAFAISELADWAVYTFTKRPLHERILLSSLLGAPIDTTVFLVMAERIVDGVFSWPNLMMSVLGKLAAAALVAEIVRRRVMRRA